MLYVRDLALELQRQGHTPVVFSSTRGHVVEEMRAAGIEVSDRPGRLRHTPDVIHGHHYAPTLVALRRWPTVPAIHVCHDHASPNDKTPIHPNIRRHFGVSRACARRLVDDGVPEGDTALMLNFVDTARFSPRATLPERARRALVFSNYAHEDTHLPAIVDACRQAGLELDVTGAGVGRIATSPERLLGGYEIVFAKAKAAIEAMAVGTAVILCDSGGVGPMVTSAEFDALRPLNFGFEAFRDPLRPGPLLREIARYDPEDAARVRDLLRSRAGLSAAVESLVSTYHEAISEHRRLRSNARGPERSALREALFLRLYWRWMAVGPERRAELTRLPAVQLIKRAVRRLLRQTGSIGPDREHRYDSQR